MSRVPTPVAAGSSRTRGPAQAPILAYEHAPAPVSAIGEGTDRGPIAIRDMVVQMRLLATIALAAWLIGGLVLTLETVRPLPGQVIDDNLIPFHTLRIYLDNLGSLFWMRNLFGNLGLLFPLGLLGPIVLPGLGRWWRLALVATLYSATIEFIQLFVPDRSADIDDVIVNVTGALLGFAVWRLVLRRLGEDGTDAT